MYQLTVHFLSQLKLLLHNMPRNRKILRNRTIREWSGGEQTFKKPNIRLVKLITSRINRGMITSIDSTDIPREALQLAKNTKVVFDKTSRRDGLSSFESAADNSPVLKMSFLKSPDGTGHTYRFTPDSIYDLQSSIWNPITETVPLIGTVNDRFNVATVFDIFAFTNNGANAVQWIDSTLDVSDDLIDNYFEYAEGAEFRYCTGFYNRIVLAALREQNEVLLAWTGEYGSKATAKHGLEDLDPLVNETSGFSPLVDSPSDVGDFITGVFGLTSIMVILREKSIWLATKQASFSNPFNAYAAVPGVGCDSPFSTKVTRYGLSWLDRRSRTVYHYTPGGTPEPIGRPVEKSIINNITDPDIVFGAYDPIEDSYSVCIPAVGSGIVRAWTYYFQAQAWTYNEYNEISSFDTIELLTGYVAIDDLVGTMDGLIGTIDGLSPVVQGVPQRIFGFTDGTLAIPDPNADTDLGVEFETDLVSAAFMLPGDDIYVANVVVEYNMKLPGTLEFWYAPDGGVDIYRSLMPTSFILGDTFTPTVLNKPQIFTFKRVIHSRRYAFSIRAFRGQFDILGYEIWVAGAGDVSMIRQVP